MSTNDVKADVSKPSPSEYGSYFVHETMKSMCTYCQINTNICLQVTGKLHISATLDREY